MAMQPMMAGESESPAEDQSEPSNAETTEKTSIFIPKDALGDRHCKPGENLTFTVKDVDPDTGEVEASLEGYDSGGESSSGFNDAMDKAMPED